MAVLRPPEPVGPLIDTAYTTDMSRSWWRWVDGDNRPVPFPDEGWKLHIGGTVDSAPGIVAQVAPVLQRMQIFHKVAHSTEMLASQTGTQEGKWFVAYPWSVLQAFEAVHEIDRCLDRLYPAADYQDLAIPVPHDRKVGRTVVYARYGQNREGGKILGSNGGSIADLRTQYKPVHIRDYWDSHYVGVGAGIPTHEWPLQFRHAFPRYNEEQARAVYGRAGRREA